MFEDITAQEKADITKLLVEAGSKDQAKSFEAQTAIAAALQTPLRSGIVVGDIISDIFTKEVLEPGAQPNYPIDLYRPDNAGDFTAYVVPNHGALPERHAEGDYVNVPTFDIGNAIDFRISYAEEARWNVIQRALEVMEAGVVKKTNDDGWHTILGAGFDRNIVVSDANAAAGQFTKRLISLIKLLMRRNAGGNANSVNRGKLTHLFVSPEAVEDVRNWGVDEVDEVTRREIFVSDDGTYNKIFGVNLVDLDELGENQEYQNFWVQGLAIPAAAANNGMASGDVEIAIGLDLSKRDSFVMPVRRELEITPDPSLHRQRRMGFYCTKSHGFGALSNVRVIAASF